MAREDPRAIAYMAPRGAALDLVRRLLDSGASTVEEVQPFLDVWTEAWLRRESTEAEGDSVAQQRLPEQWDEPLFVVLRTDSERAWALGVWNMPFSTLTALLGLPPEGWRAQSTICLRRLHSANPHEEAEALWRGQQLSLPVIYH